MPSYLQHPSFEDFPLQLTQGLWQHSSRWESTDFQFFAQQRQILNPQLFAQPKLYRHKRRHSPSLDSCWVYKDHEKGPPTGWAELQTFPGRNYKKGFVFFVLDEIPSASAEAALVALVSLVFTINRNDLLYIISGTEPGRTVVEGLAQYTGSLAIVSSPPAYAWHPRSGGMRTFQSLAVDRNSWRTCVALQDAIRALKHVEMRLERLGRIDSGHGKQRRKRRPFLARLFKPRIDDSLF